MIEINNVTKSFDNIHALKGVNTQIPEKSIFGLVGTNGSGKSTLFRIISGVFKADEGDVLIDGNSVFENTEAKANVCFLSDGVWFLPNSTAYDMAKYYKLIYPNFDMGRFNDLFKKFKLDPKRKLSRFSKGMRKQTSLILGICTNTKYLLCDETFDGLDPVMRQAVKSLFAAEILNRDFTPVIASHSLRELEDICDHVGLIHDGGILFASDFDAIKLGFHKLQFVLPHPHEIDHIFAPSTLMQYEQRGSIFIAVVKGKKEEILDIVNGFDPIFCEILPLTLEEIFISETEVSGYDFKDLLK